MILHRGRQLTMSDDQYLQRAWRELGFFYDYDNEHNAWKIVCDLDGAMKLVEVLRNYSADPAMAVVSEHIHLGPYSYFEIMTADEARITSHAIEGTQTDIARLADIIQNKLGSSPPGQKILIDKEYSDKNEAVIEFDLREYDFDPSSADPYLK